MESIAKKTYKTCYNRYECSDEDEGYLELERRLRQVERDHSRHSTKLSSFVDDSWILSHPCSLPCLSLAERSKGVLDQRRSNPSEKAKNRFRRGRRKVLQASRAWIEEVALVEV